MKSTSRAEPTKASLLGTRKGFVLAVFVLACGRGLSAAFNIIHDCDETYNYWEPLHYLLYGKGFQTWEYSPEFALRSYLYIIIHYVFAKPLSMMGIVVGGSTKLGVFYGMRCLFGLVSALTEGYLVYALGKSKRAPEGWATLCFLATSGGMFISSTSFLPGTFSMYFFTVATAGVLLGNRNALVIASCAASVILGWSVTAIAAVPYAVWVLATGNFGKSLSVAVVSAGSMLLGTFVFDSYFYGKYALSLYSFLSYNVFGSGDSALYGVENSTYYFRNGLNTLNVLLPLSLVAPLLLVLRLCFSNSKRAAGNFFAACSPQWLWILAITLLPHKEERFLYVVYPQIILAAAYTVVQVGNIVAQVAGKHQDLLRSGVFAGALAVTTALSASRVGALLWNYDANLKIYLGLSNPAETPQPCVVCVGSEWYEFPSSFFVPQNCEMNFVKSDFDGVLPAQFDSALGGTRYGASYLNDRNEAHDLQFMSDESKCTYLVSLKYDGELLPKKQDERLWVENKWETARELPYVQSASSPALYRALYIPFVSAKKLVYNYYVLYRSKT